MPSLHFIISTIKRNINDLRLKMSSAGPARLVAAYGGIAYLVYLETSGFSRTSPLLSSLPLIALSIFTLLTTMQPQAKLCTSLSFALAATSIYIQSVAWSPLSFAALFVVAGNMMYFLSFQHLIREWSIPMGIVSGLYLVFFSFLCFTDLFFSIPTLVCCLFLGLGSAVFLVFASGSLVHCGSKDEDTNAQASVLRLVGGIVEIACVSMFIYSAFNQRHETTIFLYRLLEYVAHGLFFLANEREF